MTYRTDSGTSQMHRRWAAYASHLGDYMRRWILRTPRGTLRLHNILRSDEGRDLHDHPFNFTSLILRGGYVEHRPGCLCGIHGILPSGNVVLPCRFYGPGSVVRRNATDLHRLELVNGLAWTVVITGRYFRRWGFQTAAGWVDYEHYQGRVKSPAVALG